MKCLGFALLLTTITNQAQSYDWFFEHIGNNEARITVPFITGDLTVPSSIAGYSVKEVSGPWPIVQNLGWIYGPNPYITSVVVSEGIERLGANALSSLINLTNVTIPESLTTISDGAFSGCSKLPSIHIPLNVTNIGLDAFNNCDSLVNFTVATDNPTFSADDGVLYNKAKSLLLRFPQGKNSSSFSIPTTVTEIAPSAFSMCQNLNSISIPNTVTNIDYYAFSNCTNLTSVVIPGTVVSIKQGAFNGCANLTNVIIQNGVRRIENGVFSGCTNLTSIIFPDSVTFLGSLSFMGSTSVTNLSLPLQLLPYVANLGVNEEIVGTSFLNSLVNSLATNQAFISNLAQAILTASNNYGLATASGVASTTSTLATKAELTNSLAQSRADGINSVISNPNLWTLYTTNQIKAMVMGDLMLTRTNNGQFVLNYDIEQSDDLSNWAPYAGYALPLTNLPTDKAFVRIKLKNQQ